MNWTELNDDHNAGLWTRRRRRGW